MVGVCSISCAILWLVWLVWSVWDLWSCHRLITCNHVTVTNAHQYHRADHTRSTSIHLALMAWLLEQRYLTVHDYPSKDTSLCMTPRARIPHCAWLTEPGYLTVHDSPSKNTSLCMTHRARIPHCAWLTEPGYLTVHDSSSKDTSLCMTHRARIPHCVWLLEQEYLTVHDSPSQDTSLCMTPRARIPHCAWLTEPGYLTVHDSTSQDTSLCMHPWDQWDILARDTCPLYAAVKMITHHHPPSPHTSTPYPPHPFSNNTDITVSYQHSSADKDKRDSAR